MNSPQFSTYTCDIFRKLNYVFLPGKKILDVGCGPGEDSRYLRDIYKLDVYSTDIYKNVQNRSEKFLLSSIFSLPFPNDSYDYVYLHDVLHHIDEDRQDRGKHIEGLLELKRVVKKGGTIIIVEGNRFNPLFYPHMVLMHNHQHWRQSYFKRLMSETFPEPRFQFFECHYYPWLPSVWKVYEAVMESLMPRSFLAYNAAIIENS